MKQEWRPLLSRVDFTASRLSEEPVRYPQVGKTYMGKVARMAPPGSDPLVALFSGEEVKEGQDQREPISVWVRSGEVFTQREPLPAPWA